MLPLRISDLKLSESWPRYIIIHHTHEDNVPDNFKFDTSTFQTSDLRQIKYNLNKDPIIKYHYVIEKIKQDFFPIVTQPILTKCEWPDIDETYQNGIHIGIMGNYDFDIPMTRLYTVLGFNLLFPLMRLFKLKEDRILFHRDVSLDENVTCPGEMMDIVKVRMFARRFRRTKAVSKRGG
jgi:hypothetical protein